MKKKHMIILVDVLVVFFLLNFLFNKYQYYIYKSNITNSKIINQFKIRNKDFYKEELKK